MKFLGMKKVRDGKYLKNYELSYENKAGKLKTYEIVSRKELEDVQDLGRRASGVSIVAFQDGKMLLLREFRMSINKAIFNLCAGMQEKGETIEECIRRELYEETGIKVEKEALIPFDHVITPRIFSDTYLLILNEEPEITLQSTETVAYAWLTPAELLERCRKGMVIGHLAERFARYAQMLSEMLQKEENHG